MKELLDTLATWQPTARRRRRRPRGRRPDVRVRAATRGRRPAVRDRRPDRGLGQRRLRRGRRGRGDRARPARPATPGSSATGSATSRPGTSGLACGGTIDVLVEPVAPAVVIEAARGSVGAGGHGSAVVTPLPADSPPGEFGPHQPGDGAPPAAELIVTRRRHADRVARLAGPRRRSWSRPPARPSGAACRGPSSSAAGRCSSRSSRSGRGSSSSAASRSPARSSASPASSASRPSSSMAGRPSRRRSASPTSTGWSSAGRTRSPTRSGSARTTPSPSCPTTSSSTSPRSSRRSGAAAGTSARSARARPRRDRRARLLEAGVSEAELARLRGPVGLDLGGRAPAETALAILAEIVAERYGGIGRADARASDGPRLT